VESVALGALEDAARRYLDTAQPILVVVGDQSEGRRRPAVARSRPGGPVGRRRGSDLSGHAPARA
jgi:hypothetical protein